MKFLPTFCALLLAPTLLADEPKILKVSDDEVRLVEKINSTDIARLAERLKLGDLNGWDSKSMPEIRRLPTPSTNKAVLQALENPETVKQLQQILKDEKQLEMLNQFVEKFKKDPTSKPDSLPPEIAKLLEKRNPLGTGELPFDPSKMDPGKLRQLLDPKASPWGRPNDPFRPVPQGMKLNEEQQKKFRELAGWWERNLGSLDDSPDMKEFLKEALAAAGDGADWNDLAKDLLNDTSNGQDPLDFLGLDFSWLRSPFGGTQDPLPPIAFDPDKLEAPKAGSWIPVILFFTFAVASLALFWYRFLRKPRLEEPQTARRHVTLPFDPRTVHDPESLIRAFEGLGIATCGERATTWNHRAIAEALQQALPENAEEVEPLAETYALARYAPAPLANEAVREARRRLCRLAGVAE